MAKGKPVTNVAGIYMTCAYDKRAAIKKERRASKRPLFAIAVPGGSAGVFAAMPIKRHKTRKPKFMAGISLIMILQAVSIIYLLKIF